MFVSPPSAEDPRSEANSPGHTHQTTHTLPYLTHLEISPKQTNTAQHTTLKTIHSPTYIHTGPIHTHPKASREIPDTHSYKREGLLASCTGSHSST
ncbi:hypothetical protein DL95DRAFT_22219 [Leptodontidium sp. 2 PMI_412]|nr:hypothetical protein DL95DRAFT_22219 [Leptodontidium sp. 2 PMI_412]